MRHIYSLIFLLLSSSLGLIASNDLLITGQLTQVTNGQTSPVAGQTVFFTYNGPNSTESWQTTTGEQGFYEISLAGMSVIGPNRLIIVSTPGCNGAMLADTVSNMQGTVDIATVNFLVCSTEGGNPCNAAFEALPAPNGQGVYFLSNQSTGTLLSYTWSLNGVEFATTQNAELSLEPGSYVVCLSIVSGTMDPIGCQDQICQTIEVSGSGTECEAAFTAQVSPNNPLRMIFNNTSSTLNTQAEYAWSFGDGETANSTSAEHTYAQAGNYTVCLVSYSPACTDTFCTTVNVPGSNGIFLAGRIYAGGQARNDAQALLYSIDPATGLFSLIADDNTDSLGRYFFGNLSAGTYAVKGRIQPNTADFGNYSPTWHTNALYWENATLIELSASGDEYHITLPQTTNTGGPGEVNGNVDEGPGRYADPSQSGVAASGPAANADVLITNLSGGAQRWTQTDANGNFSVSGLNYGTYLLFADVAGMMAIPVEFTISEQSPQATVNFVLGDVITALTLAQNKALVYPNPSANGLCTITGLSEKTHSIEVYTLQGKQVFNQQNTKAAEQIILNLEQLSSGRYIIQINNVDGEKMNFIWIRE